MFLPLTIAKRCISRMEHGQTIATLIVQTILYLPLHLKVDSIVSGISPNSSLWNHIAMSSTFIIHYASLIFSLANDVHWTFFLTDSFLSVSPTLQAGCVGWHNDFGWIMMSLTQCEVPLPLSNSRCVSMLSNADTVSD